MSTAPGYRAIYVKEETWKALVWFQTQTKMLGKPMSMDEVIRLLLKEAGYEIQRDEPYKGFISLKPTK
jgi:hypothetical protein